MFKHFNKETAMHYQHNFARDHRAISILWAVMSIVFCVLLICSFAQPQWLGDTPKSPGYGHMGIFRICAPSANPSVSGFVCKGKFTEFPEIVNDSFRAATVLVGVSCILMLINVAILFLFFCFKKGSYIYNICGVLELIVAVFMFLACVIYPSGWDIQEVKDICGDTSGQYQLGYCNIRWAYILAIIGIFDAAILAVLAFFLAAKRAKIEIYTASGTVTKSELNGYSAESMSKRSIPIQPIVTVPDSGRSASNFQL